MGPPPLERVVALLDEALDARRYDEGPALLRPAARPVARLGLALEPAPGLAAWAAGERLDALWLHRPWGWEAAGLPPALGVAAHHLPFDDALTVGRNPRLARALGLTGTEPFGERDGRVLGMIGAAPVPPGGWAARAVALFGGLEARLPGAGGDGGRLAAVGAMTPALVRAATDRGVGVYLTGQLRARAAPAARAAGLEVLAVGHARAERYGLRLLAEVLREGFGGLEPVLGPA